MNKNMQTAYDIYESGTQPVYSTGICGRMTAGYGDLSDEGYWEYPLEVGAQGIIPRGLRYKLKSLIAAGMDNDVMVIAHQANCCCTMGSGIAPLIAKAFPAAEAADNATEPNDIDKLGSFTFAHEHGVDVYNLYGQFYPGANTDYKFLRKSLLVMRDDLLERYPQQRVTIGLPKLGAGIGGGDWGVISDLIKQNLSVFDVVIYVIDEREIPTGG